MFFNIPLNLIALALFLLVVFVNGGKLDFLIGIAILSLFVASVFLSKINNHEIKIKTRVKFNILILFISLAGLIFFGKLSVDYFLAFSRLFGIEESVLGYFVIAIGTSLPELIASFTAIKKGNREMGIGNILGSNLFNLLIILGASSLITPLDLNEFLTEIGLLAFITVSLVVLAFIGKKYYFTPLEGIFLLSCYAVFVFSQLG